MRFTPPPLSDPPIPSALRAPTAVRERAMIDNHYPMTDSTPAFQIGPYHFAPTNCDRASQRVSCRKIIDEIVERYNR